MNTLRALWRYLSIKLVVAFLMAIIMYAVYWPLFFDATCQLRFFGLPWFFYAWTVLPGLTPLLVLWFDQIKRKKDIDLDGFSYILMAINLINFYGGLSFWHRDTRCLVLFIG